MTTTLKPTNPKYVSTKVAQRALGIHESTLRSWADGGKIDYIRPNQGGKRLYNVESVTKKISTDDIIAINDTDETSKTFTYCYCRVSTRNQKDDLKRQVQSMRELYPTAVIIEDIGSGLNWKRRGLQTIITKAIEGEVGEVVIHHRDRLCRFAYELIESVLNRFGTKIVVLDQDLHEPNIDQELSDDLLSIIHVFSCRKMGRRRYQKQPTENGIPGEKQKESDQSST